MNPSPTENGSTLTLVIPTRNRSEGVESLLKYYRECGFSWPVLILDSSDSARPVASADWPFPLEYHCFKPEVPFYEKLLSGVRRAGSPFVCVTADDDFLVRDGLEDSVGFLQRNPEYVVSHGKYLAFIRSRVGPFRRDTVRSIGEAPEIDHADPYQRLERHMRNYEPTIYGVHRTSALIAALELSITHTDDFRFGELLPSYLTAIAGKLHKSDAYFSVRDSSRQSTSKTASNMAQFAMEGTFQLKLARVVDALDKALDEAGVSGQKDRLRSLLEQVVTPQTAPVARRRFPRLRKSVVLEPVRWALSFRRLLKLQGINTESLPNSVQRALLQADRCAGPGHPI